MTAHIGEDSAEYQAGGDSNPVASVMEYLTTSEDGNCVKCKHPLVAHEWLRPVDAGDVFCDDCTEKVCRG